MEEIDAYHLEKGFGENDNTHLSLLLILIYIAITRRIS